MRLLLLAALVLQTPSVASAADTVSLFDGESLAGWTVSGEGNQLDQHWQVIDGQIVAENNDSQPSILWTEREFGDFVIELDYRTPSEYYDTGVFLRGESHQVQIGISGSLNRDMTGCIYAPVDGNGGYPAKSNKVDEHHRVGAWNHMKIVVEGDRIRTSLNGELFVDYKAVKLVSRGPIGLQLHAGHHMQIFFKNLSLKELVAQTAE